MFLIPLSSLSREFHIFVTRGKYEFLNIECYIYITRHNFRNVLIYNGYKIDTTLYLNLLSLQLVVLIGSLILTLRSTTKQAQRRAQNFKVSMQRKIQLCFYDLAWYLLMRWILLCCWIFNYSTGKYCIPHSNINILIPKISPDWDRIRSLVTSYVGVMLGHSNISRCLSQCVFISHFLRLERVTSQRQFDLVVRLTKFV